MKTTQKKYDHEAIEPKWQSEWENNGLYHLNLETAKRPFYNLMMFPYPSAEGMHAGNFFTFTGADTFGRYKQMQGYDVFEPIGLDGFGIHSENYAIKVGSHPVEQSEKSEENFYRQFRATGNMFDYTKTVETYKPEYYKWTQWLFVQLFKKGLAYRKKSPVNFCPSCKTVLADEQVIDGKCERCSSIVERKNLEQWFFRITKYADRLLANIDGPSGGEAGLDWTEKVKIAQRNWIGKKEGILISYEIEGLEKKVEVFTTRPDTNFGATFIALAPEHPLVQQIINEEIKAESTADIKAYVESTKNKSEIDRQAEGKEKTGVFTGLYAINQLTGFRMPIWVSDFVLMGFGTGAVVGVPGHDRRDFEFAHKFGLKIIRVVTGSDGDISPIEAVEQVQEDEGMMVNSQFLDGMKIHDATQKIMDYLEEKEWGKREVTFHLRDWLISRQRYWGPPIPMIYCTECADKGNSWFTTDAAQDTRVYDIDYLLGDNADSKEVAGWYPVEDADLPVKLPYIEDFKPFDSAQGVAAVAKGPLANHPEFYEVKCPHCGSPAQRETDVSDTFLDSAWYFLRYLATDWDDLPFPSVKFLSEHSEKSANREVGKSDRSDSQKNRLSKSSELSEIKNRARFLPVSMYIGGAEHSVLHLLYARFITMVIKDLGLIDFEEPFSRFYAHGLIIKDGAKMSKSKGNIINPDEYIQKYGADTLRMYLRFLAPFNQDGDFRDSGIEGMNRYIRRVWTMLSSQNFSSTDPLQSANKIMHQTIKKVTEEMENLRFNTAIAQLMTYYNFLSKQDKITRIEAENYLKMLAPFAPFMTEELWRDLGNKESIHKSKWPEYDEKYLVSDTVSIPVQINGKLRGMLEIPSTDIANQEKVEILASKDVNVSKFLEGQPIKKTIYIKGKVINFVL